MNEVTMMVFGAMAIACMVGMVACAIDRIWSNGLRKAVGVVLATTGLAIVSTAFMA